MRKFLKPTGAPVYLPDKDRMILAEGESVEVTGYIERLIASGDLAVAEKPAKKAPQKMNPKLNKNRSLKNESLFF